MIYTTTAATAISPAVSRFKVLLIAVALVAALAIGMVAGMSGEAQTSSEAAVSAVAISGAFGG